MGESAVSYRPHPAQDVVPGSRWVSAHGTGYAIVISAAAGYVAILFTDGGEIVQERMHHNVFRERFVAPYDSREVRSKFSMYLANLAEFHAFWSAASKRLLARSSTRSPKDAFAPARGSPALPKDAIHVGTYAQPFSPDAFLADLNDAIAGSSTSAAA